MSRDLPAPIDAVLDDPFVLPVYLAEFQFDTDPLYVHTDIGDITVLGQTWLGTGELGRISQVEESEEPTAPGIKFRLGTTQEGAGTLLEELTNQDFYQRPIIVYISFRDTITGALVNDPIPLWRGRADVPEFEEGIPLSFVNLTAENEWIDGKKAPGQLYTDAQLQSEFPGDIGFRYVAAMANTSIVWGARRTISFSGATSPTPGTNIPGNGSGTPVFSSR